MGWATCGSWPRTRKGHPSASSNHDRRAPVMFVGRAREGRGRVVEAGGVNDAGLENGHYPGFELSVVFPVPRCRRLQIECVPQVRGRPRASWASSSSSSSSLSAAAVSRGSVSGTQVGVPWIRWDPSISLRSPGGTGPLLNLIQGPGRGQRGEDCPEQTRGGSMVVVGNGKAGGDMRPAWHLSQSPTANDGSEWLATCVRGTAGAEGALPASSRPGQYCPTQRSGVGDIPPLRSPTQRRAYLSSTRWMVGITQGPLNIFGGQGGHRREGERLKGRHSSFRRAASGEWGLRKLVRELPGWVR